MVVADRNRAVVERPRVDMRRLKRIALNVGLALASLVLTTVALFGVGELYFRWHFGWSIGSPHPLWSAFDPQRGWVLKPGQYSYVDLFAFRKFHVSINSLGIRHREISLKVPNGVVRISVLGDSFVFSAPLNAEERFTERLERLDGNLEVVNIGVPGYGTGQEILLLEEMIAKGYEVGAKIVLVFFPNDLQDNLGLDYGSLRRLANRPAFSVNAVGDLEIDPAVPGGANPSAAGFGERSLSYRFLISALIKIAVAHPSTIDVAEWVGGTALALPRSPGIVAGWYSDGWQGRWRATEDVLRYSVRRMRELTSAEIVLVYVPSPFQTVEAFRRIIASNAISDERYRALLTDGDRPQRLLRQFAESVGIPLVDLTTALSDGGGTEAPLYFPREGHLAERGSQRVARELARVLGARDWPARQ